MIICYAISLQIGTKTSLERAESAPESKDHVTLFVFCYSLDTQGWRSSRVRAHNNERKWRPLDLGFTLKLALAFALTGSLMAVNTYYVKRRVNIARNTS